MIRTKEELVQFLLETEPGYATEHRENQKHRERPQSISGEASDFSDFVGDRLREGNYDNAKKVFDDIESLLRESASTQEIQEALCTCFLENLINRFSGDAQIAGRFVPLLGPESRDYCKGWDEFTGARTPGLWSDDEWKEALKRRARRPRPEKE